MQRMSTAVKRKQPQPPPKPLPPSSPCPFKNATARNAFLLLSAEEKKAATTPLMMPDYYVTSIMEESQKPAACRRLEFANNPADYCEPNISVIRAPATTCLKHSIRALPLSVRAAKVATHSFRWTQFSLLYVLNAIELFAQLQNRSMLEKQTKGLQMHFGSLPVSREVIQTLKNDFGWGQSELGRTRKYVVEFVQLRLCELLSTPKQQQAFDAYEFLQTQFYPYVFACAAF